MKIVTNNPWLLRKSNTNHKIRLFCFHFAGGSAGAFRELGNLMPESIQVNAVQLPGRENRFGEPVISDLKVLIPQVAAALKESMAEGPFAFLGYSMGSIVAFELIRYLRKNNLPLPLHFFPAARRGPDMPLREEPVHTRPDEGIVDMLRKYGGTSDAVLQEKELLDLFIPIIRADFSILETYQYKTDEPLNMPISILAGKNDETQTEEEIAAWEKHTTGPYKVHMNEGGHFFIQTHAAEMISRIREELESTLAVSLA